ncbi:MAG TPA: SpoIIE family protein phosphatase, partial [Bacteroidia bacterium]|nr:SpoIIE family protein phosphatase [Bacteroidia bacterium]
MAFRFTIERKILLGFGSLIVLTFIAFGLTLITLTESKRINDKITNLYTPSVGVLEELNLLVIRSKMYISSWVNAPIESEDKEKLKLLIKKEYPELKERINILANEWSNEDKEIIKTIFSLFDDLTTAHQYIMGQLSTFESYREPVVFFEVKNMVEDADGKVNEKTRKILNNLTALINHQHKQAIQKNKEMLDSFELLQKIVITLGILLLIGGILIALFTARTIVRPVAEVKELLLRMARGILPDKKINEGTDEIGEMSLALNRLIGTMKLTTEFAREVGSGNFDSYYTPLSDEDALGLALIKMREDLRVNERMLEDKVALRTSEVLQQKAEIEIQSKKIEIFYKQVTDSIRYAKRIQEAILPPDNFVRKLMPDSFVLYKPKDIVSGDFYWFDQVDNKIFFATVDCTGHGVPGAFMSIVGHNLLKQIMNTKHYLQPAKILDELNKGVRETLHQRNFEDSATKDGMDIIICSFDKSNYELEFAAAFNPLLLIRNKELSEIKGNKFSVGIYLEKETRSFTNHKLQMQKGDVIYIFSDGYADQFGGPRGKKFMQSQLRNLLLDIHQKPMPEQKRILDQTIEHWRGNEDQVDDILVMGFRIN